MEQNNRYMGKDWYIERNNKLYLCAPSGLGGGTEVSSADIQVTKESSTSYIVKVRAVYIPFNRVENTTAHYVLENGEWCFDQIMYFPEIESARVTCTVK